jgi:hypothetical protein
MLQELLALVGATRGWHMQAKIGESKSAAMLFAPEASPGPLGTGDIAWAGATPVPAVATYKYLGVMLAAEWARHLDYIAAKATQSAGPGGVLHNRRVLTEARGVVLLAVIRPIVSGPPQPTGAAAERVEDVMVRVMRRFIRVGCNTAVDILHLEFGCRFGRMPAERLLCAGPCGRVPSAQSCMSTACRRLSV